MSYKSLIALSALSDRAPLYDQLRFFVANAVRPFHSLRNSPFLFPVPRAMSNFPFLFPHVNKIFFFFSAMKITDHGRPHLCRLFFPTFPSPLIPQRQTLICDPSRRSRFLSNCLHHPFAFLILLLLCLPTTLFCFWSDKRTSAPARHLVIRSPMDFLQQHEPYLIVWSWLPSRCNPVNFFLSLAFHLIRPTPSRYHLSLLCPEPPGMSTRFSSSRLSSSVTALGLFPACLPSCMMPFYVNFGPVLIRSLFLLSALFFFAEILVPCSP